MTGDQKISKYQELWKKHFQDIESEVRNEFEDEIREAINSRLHERIEDELIELEGQEKEKIKKGVNHGHSIDNQDRRTGQAIRD